MNRGLRTSQRRTTRANGGDLSRAALRVAAAILIVVVASLPALAGDDPQPASLTSRVIDEAGKPVARATVVVAVAGSQVVITNGEVRNDGGFHVTAVTDEAGRFVFPTQKGDMWFAVTHPTGYAEVKCSRQAVPESIKLAPWLRVEGTYLVARKPQANVRLRLNRTMMNVGGQKVTWIIWQSLVHTDANGRFVFDRALPGLTSIERNLSFNGNQGATEVASGTRIQTRLTAGRTTHIDFGASGRPVIGKLQHAADLKHETAWNFAYVNVTPLVHLFQAPSFGATVDREGNFSINDVPPGEYVLQVNFIKNPFEEGAGEHLAAHRFTVPEINEKLAQRPVDLGVLTLQPGGRLRVMAAPPAKN
ncbi:MAG TPA: hypothetical protein VGP76_03370 [Planctomycetaceae bacterium]|jgi:protocatechuate 3,4-dioxygenase beta subunit|nr:hypothetical protein [Planctomycetaceae bacterium]